ncbi:hypothetical protein RchiOBHm_Chr3g0494811 [Rosa chinensis]|uniref:Uncharacterized protein n=1 Tax=Rosa chinensis TaxID=74649 RepID=A0A2P6RH33_ROSCH|nr:hypothetical protein RchiOBHm_Chr3g0494811 [Rosa chinensis]
MAYIDHPFSIADVDIMMEISYTVNNKPPIKEIAVDIAVTETLDIVVGTLMAYNLIGGDKAHSTLMPPFYCPY